MVMTGNSYDFGERIQDPRLGGRFLSLDKFSKLAPYQSPYVATQDFFKNTSDDIIQYTRKNGDVVRYDKANNVFGVAKEDGTIRTFFKPKRGADYFKDEVTKDLGESAAKAVDEL